MYIGRTWRLLEERCVQKDRSAGILPPSFNASGDLYVPVNIKTVFIAKQLTVMEARVLICVNIFPLGNY